LIAQHNGMAARDFDCATQFEVPQNARDCLKGKAKIIRDIPASHWQMNEIILSWRCALDHLYEETDYPVFCSRAQKYDELILLMQSWTEVGGDEPAYEQAQGLSALATDL